MANGAPSARGGKPSRVAPGAAPRHGGCEPASDRTRGGSSRCSNTRDETRTRIPRRVGDFESPASTDSATRAGDEDKYNGDGGVALTACKSTCYPPRAGRGAFGVGRSPRCATAPQNVPCRAVLYPSPQFPPEHSGVNCCARAATRLATCSLDARHGRAGGPAGRLQGAGRGCSWLPRTPFGDPNSATPGAGVLPLLTVLAGDCMLRLSLRVISPFWSS